MPTHLSFDAGRTAACGASIDGAIRLVTCDHKQRVFLQRVCLRCFVVVDCDRCWDLLSAGITPAVIEQLGGYPERPVFSADPHVHFSRDGGETAVCDTAAKPFPYIRVENKACAADVTCPLCIRTVATVTRAFKGADPKTLQSVGVRLFDASGAENMSIQVNVRDYELEVASVNRVDPKTRREIIEFKLTATRRN